MKIVCISDSLRIILGINDVNQALIWVNENIEKFGGDPSNITIAGQSAGAWYAVLMMGNPKLKGLYKRAGLFSFNGGTAPYLKAEAKVMADKLLEKMDIPVTVSMYHFYFEILINGKMHHF